jgi:UDP-2,3-diacylglucosamine pyrophosphatase LpxH
MSKVAVIISDIHLGSNDRLNDFDSHSEFEEFLNGKIAREFPDDELALVLLGDVFDLWQAVPANELPKRRGSKVDWDLNAIQLELEIDREKARLQEIVQRNSDFFESLAKFLGGGQQRKVFFIPGNHDHSLVADEVRRELRDILAGFGINQEQLNVEQPYYENIPLQVYAEHGSQFDGDNRYDEFTSFHQGEATYEEECKGYFFVRLFWNLLESLDRSVEHGPSRWYKVFAWLAKNRRFKLIPVALKLFHDYEKQGKKLDFERISVFEQIGNILAVEEEGREKEMLFMLPENLFKDEFDPYAVFSYNHTVEEFYRKLYHAGGDEGELARTLLDEILRDKSEKLNIPCEVPPAEDSSLDLDKELAEINYVERVIVNPEDFSPGAARGIFTRDKDQVAAEDLLTPGNRSSLKEEPLDEQIKYIIFGHTHKCVKQSLGGGATYFNTGTWESWEDEKGTKHKDLTYVLIHDKAGTERIEADLHRL